MTFAEQLQKHRQRLDLTQAEAAALLDVSKRTYEYWEIDRVPLAVTQEGALARLENLRTSRSGSPRVNAGRDGGRIS
jgi:DNA-binding XRE family transcriptional regulator